MLRRIMSLSVVVVATVQISLVVCQAAPGAEFWAQFRGPNQNGSLEVDSIPDTWSTDSHIAWECEIEGGGNSSPVIWGNKLFLTSAKLDGGTVSETLVIALERASGKQIWRTRVPVLSLPGRPPSQENGWATPTPACDHQRVVVVFATGTMACLSHEGNLLWTHDLGPLEHLWGLAASPVLDGSRVYYAVDQGSLCRHPSYLTAIDLVSGKAIWRTNLIASIGRGYSTPMLISRGTRSELVLWAQSKLTAYDPATGQKLWEVKTFEEKEPIATPVLAEGRLYLGQSNQLLAFAIPTNNEEKTIKPLWTLNQTSGAEVARIAGCVVYRDRVYGVSNEGVASCYDGKTGRKIWSGDLNDQFYAAPVAAAGRVIFASRSGRFHLLRAGDAFDPIQTVTMAQRCDVSPAIAEGRLYLRTKLGSNRTTVWCVDK
jgi:outer membrane protein assembly factor BamB